MVLARIDAKPHPSAVDEVINLLLSDTIEQKLILSDESNCVADTIYSNFAGDNHDGWITKRRKHNENIIIINCSSTSSTAAS